MKSCIIENSDYCSSFAILNPLISNPLCGGSTISWPHFCEIHSATGSEGCWQVHGVTLSLKPPWHQGDRVFSNTCWSTSSWSFSNPCFLQGCHIKVISYSQRTSRSSRLTSCYVTSIEDMQHKLCTPSFHCWALVTVTQMVVNSVSQLFQVNHHRTGRKCALRVVIIKCYVPNWQVFYISRIQRDGKLNGLCFNERFLKEQSHCQIWSQMNQ